MGNKAHLRPHRKKRQASLTTGLLLVILFIALVALAVAMVASGHALPAGRIFPLRRGPLCSGFKACPLRGVRHGTHSHGFSAGEEDGGRAGSDLFE